MWAVQVLWLPTLAPKEGFCGWSMDQSITPHETLLIEITVGTWHEEVVSLVDLIALALPV